MTLSRLRVGSSLPVVTLGRYQNQLNKLVTSSQTSSSRRDTYRTLPKARAFSAFQTGGKEKPQEVEPCGDKVIKLNIKTLEVTAFDLELGYTYHNWPQV